MSPGRHFNKVYSVLMFSVTDVIAFFCDYFSPRFRTTSSTKDLFLPCRKTSMPTSNSAKMKSLYKTVPNIIWSAFPN